MSPPFDWGVVFNWFFTSAECAPPTSGDWVVPQNCTLSQDATALANVIINQNVTLTIAAGVVLDIDLSSYHLKVKDGGKVVIRDGGKIH